VAHAGGGRDLPSGSTWSGAGAVLTPAAFTDSSARMMSLPLAMVLAACVWPAGHYSALFGNSPIFCILLTNFALTNYYRGGETKE
jgi:hypothetical protein